MTNPSYLLNWCMRDRTTRELLTTTGTPTETKTAMCCSLWQEASHTTSKKPSSRAASLLHHVAAGRLGSVEVDLELVVEEVPVLQLVDEEP